jgi:EAL domain-containing protein (putative c-di-GMP-specific phosphodiesterase class I)
MPRERRSAWTTSGGYSSLAHFHGFPVDIVKINRSCVERITLDDAAAAIVRAGTNLAHELGHADRR